MGPAVSRGYSRDVAEQRVFRSPTAVVVWWVWVLFAVGNLVDIAVQGRDHLSLVAAFVLVAVTGLMYAGAQRPRLVVDEGGVTIVNPLREHRVGWAAITAIDTTDLVRVRCEWPSGDGGEPGRKTLYAWAVGTSRRRQHLAQIREQRRTRSSRTPASSVFAARDRAGAGGDLGRPESVRPGGSEAGDPDRVVAVLKERADEARAAAPEARAARAVSTWSWPALAAVAVPLLALLIAALA